MTLKLSFNNQQLDWPPNVYMCHQYVIWKENTFKNRTRDRFKRTTQMTQLVAGLRVPDNFHPCPNTNNLKYVIERIRSQLYHLAVYPTQPCRTPLASPSDSLGESKEWWLMFYTISFHRKEEHSHLRSQDRQHSQNQANIPFIQSISCINYKGLQSGLDQFYLFYLIFIYSQTVMT